MPVNRALERQDTPARQRVQDAAIRQALARNLAIRRLNTCKRNPKFKGTDTFPEEVWLAIFRQLRNPIPEPLSCPPRSEIRQTELCNVLRSCRLFQALCTPLLYRSPITDDICGFLEGFEKKKRRDLLAHVHHLYIEYCEKRTRPYYWDLLEKGGRDYWGSIESNREADLRTIRLACDIEIEGIMNVLQDVNLSDYSTKNILPNLRTIAVSSIYGEPNDDWFVYDEHQRSLLNTPEGEDPYENTNLIKVVDQFDKFLSTSNVQHICIRNPLAPLSIRAISARPRLNPTYRPYTILHYPARPAFLGAMVGKPSRWVSDEPSTGNWRETYEWVTALLVEWVEARNDSYRQYNQDILQLDIYGSTRNFGSLVEWKPDADDHPASIPRLTHIRAETPGADEEYLSEEVQRAMAAKIGPRIQDEMRKGSKVKDVVNWYAACDTPRCEGCGSGPPA